MVGYRGMYLVSLIAFATFALLVLALVASACSGGGDDEPPKAAGRTTTTVRTTTTTEATTTTEPPRPLVGAVGDSNLFLVRDALPAAVPEAEVVVDAIVGLTANDAMPAVERVRSRLPVAVVVVLGTNDARDGPTADNDLAAVRRVARRLGAVPCVRWATVNDHSRFPTMNEGARAINEELDRQAAARPGFAVIPWAAELAQHPSWLSEDGLHNSAEGQAAFTERLATALRGCLRSEESTTSTGV
jgi:lysophospholipase L1-like esterase